MHFSGGPSLSFTFKFVAFAATFFYSPDFGWLEENVDVEIFISVQKGGKNVVVIMGLPPY